MFYSSLRVFIWAAAFVCFVPAACLQAYDLRLVRVSADRTPVGERMTWQAVVSSDAPTLRYQFSVAPPGGSFSIIRDFTSSSNWVAWSPMKEGWYTLRVIARDADSGEGTTATAEFEVLSRLGDEQRAVVSPTANPMVFLYSAPVCEVGFHSVRFRKAADPQNWTYATPSVCDGAKSENTLIGGLEPDTDYVVTHADMEDMGEAGAFGPEVPFHSGKVLVKIPAGSVMEQQSAAMDSHLGLLLESEMSSGGGIKTVLPVVRKLDGTVVWYYDSAANGALQNLLRPVPGGGMLVVASGDIPSGLREIDLSGNPIWETNPEAVSVRLMELGLPPIGGFHHDALKLPGGAILALADRNVEVPGATPDEPTRFVNGDVLVMLDRNFEVLWFWDSFEKLDVNRRAVLGEASSPATGPSVEDWTHGNAVEYLPDGNLLFSIRHQDWVVKIDFRDGTGTGDVIWRFGKDGDFQLNSTEPTDWFSHQHDAHFDGRRLWLYDNGNTRREAWGGPFNSRGQVYLVDEENRTASLELSADLGEASDSQGSAQRLSNGNYHFLSGMLVDGSRRFNESEEVSPAGLGGAIRYCFQVNSASYRSFRLHSLY